MGSKIGLAAALIAATGIAATGIARADVYSVTTPFSLIGFEADSPNFILSRFNTGLGALQAMTVDITGTYDTVYFGTGLPPDTPFPVGYHNSILIGGNGFGGNETAPDTFGLARYSYAQSPAVPFGGTYQIAPRLLAYYSSPCSMTDCEFYGDAYLIGVATMFDPATGGPVPNNSNGSSFADYNSYFNFTITETFTYQPADVPEPGSLALLAAGLAMIVAAKRGKWRKPL